MPKRIDDYCFILGIGKETTREEVNKAYNELLKVWDPEQFQHNGGLKNKALRKIKEIDNAYKNILLNMTDPQDEYRFVNKSSRPIRNPKETEDKKPEIQVSLEQVRPRAFSMPLSFRDIKPLTALPNILFVVYVLLVFALKMKHYEAFSVHLLLAVLKMNIWYLMPPFILLILYDFTNCGAKKMKLASLCLTSIYMILVATTGLRNYNAPSLSSEKGVTAPSPAIVCDSWVRKGDELKAQRKYKEAVEAYSKAISLNPQNADAYYNRSVVFSLTNKDKEFIIDCRTAARLGHRDAIITLNRLDIRF